MSAFSSGFVPAKNLDTFPAFAAILQKAALGPVLGWKKQPYSGATTVRSRGDSASQTLKFAGFCKQLVVNYSKETDGGTFNVVVKKTVLDDAGAATTTTISTTAVNCSGAQSFANVIAIDLPELGYFDVELQAPASGYAYLEMLHFRKMLPGIEVIDATWGGSSISQWLTAPAATGNQVAPVATVGNNGIDAHVGRADIQAACIAHCVNDAGYASGQPTRMAAYKAAIDYIVETTSTRSTKAASGISATHLSHPWPRSPSLMTGGPTGLRPQHMAGVPAALPAMLSSGCQPASSSATT
jgi:hypothetical protein